MVPQQSVSTQLLLLCLILIPIRGVFSDEEIPICSCSNITNPNPSFNTSLNDLLSVLAEKASSSKLYNTSVGNNQSGDSVYGKFMCLNYRSNDSCRTCVTKAQDDITERCPNTVQGIIWEEFCQLYFSQKSLVGESGLLKQNRWQQNPKNVSDPEKFRLVVNDTLNAIADQAAFNHSKNLYDTMEADFKMDTAQSLYSLVQCDSDLSAIDCYDCLVTAIADAKNCCDSSLGVRVLSQNCYLRYEVYSFYSNDSSEEGRSRGTRWTTVAFPIAIPCLIIAVFCSWVLCFVRKWKEEIEREQGRPPLLFDFLKKCVGWRRTRSPFYDFRDLRAATDYFSDNMKLGQGGFGPVYKGVLRDGTEIAVKRLQETLSEQGSKEFRNEVLMIMKLQHNNLVKLLGFSLERDEKLLVYEYMPNSSLDVFLFDPNKGMQLDWSRRLNIITGIARGIIYLHEDSRQTIIHRDLKASNILLDADMNPKISDFGIARIFAGTEASANTAIIMGTLGYMAPEYAMDGLYSVKSDVFSFGVLLLEIVTGKMSTGFSSPRLTPSSTLPAYAWQMWSEGKGLELKDPLLQGSCDPEQFMRCVHIGLLCVQQDPVDRPTLSSIIVMLKQETVVLRQPQRPAFSMRRFTDNNDHVSVNGLTISSILSR